MGVAILPKKRLLAAIGVLALIATGLSLLIVHLFARIMIDYEVLSHAEDRTRTIELGTNPDFDTVPGSLKRQWGTLAFDYTRGAKACAVMILHGHQATRFSARRYHDVAASTGCSIVMPDLPFHGSSIAQHANWGVTERYDILALSQWIEAEWQIPRSAQGILAESLGAAIALQTAAISDDPFAFLWLDSSYADLVDIVKYHGSKLFGELLIDLFLQPAFYLAGLRSELDPVIASPLKAIRTLPAATPVGIVHAKNDPATPVSHAIRLAKQLPESRKSVWLVPKLEGHAQNIDAAREEYQQRFTSFLQKHGIFGDL